MNRPSLALAIALNRAVREDDEWFDEPDDLDRVDSALHAIDDIDDAIAALASSPIEWQRLKHSARRTRR